MNDDLIKRHWERLGGAISDYSEFKKVAEFYYHQGFIDGSGAVLGGSKDLIKAKPQ